MLSPKEVVNKWVDAFNDGDVDGGMEKMVEIGRAHV